jgi:hypothetical protein
MEKFSNNTVVIQRGLKLFLEIIDQSQIYEVRYMSVCLNLKSLSILTETTFSDCEHGYRTARSFSHGSESSNEFYFWEDWWA